MRIVVHGQQAFGKAVLEALIKRGENVVAVYVAPEKEGAKADPLKEAALAAKLPVYQPASYRKPEVWEEFRALKPDLQVMAFVTLFVPEEFLNTPTKGSIQYHPSLLPKYRGPSAINWPIIQGEATCCCRRRPRSRIPTRSARSISTGCFPWASRRCWSPSIW
jgi:methionyl-tRNA formyltransferase